MGRSRPRRLLDVGDLERKSLRRARRRQRQQHTSMEDWVFYCGVLFFGVFGCGIIGLHMWQQRGGGSLLWWRPSVVARGGRDMRAEWHQRTVHRKHEQLHKLLRSRVHIHKLPAGTGQAARTNSSGVPHALTGAYTPFARLLRPEAVPDSAVPHGPGETVFAKADVAHLKQDMKEEEDAVQDAIRQTQFPVHQCAGPSSSVRLLGGALPEGSVADVLVRFTGYLATAIASQRTLVLFGQRSLPSRQLAISTGSLPFVASACRDAAFAVADWTTWTGGDKAAHALLPVPKDAWRYEIQNVLHQATLLFVPPRYDARRNRGFDHWWYFSQFLTFLMRPTVFVRRQLMHLDDISSWSTWHERPRGDSAAGQWASARRVGVVVDWDKAVPYFRGLHANDRNPAGSDATVLPAHIQQAWRANAGQQRLQLLVVGTSEGNALREQVRALRAKYPNTRLCTLCGCTIHEEQQAQIELPLWCGNQAWTHSARSQRVLAELAYLSEADFFVTTSQNSMSCAAFLLAVQSAAPHSAQRAWRRDGTAANHTQDSGDRYHWTTDRATQGGYVPGWKHTVSAAISVQSVLSGAPIVPCRLLDDMGVVLYRHRIPD